MSLDNPGRYGIRVRLRDGFYEVYRGHDNIGMEVGWQRQAVECFRFSVEVAQGKYDEWDLKTGRRK